MPTLDALNALSPEAAHAEFLKCCQCVRWADTMAEMRPFPDPGTLLGSADRVWQDLGPDEWLEAFEGHPKIGDSSALRARFAATHDWAEGEQAGAGNASEATLEALKQSNDAYEAKFGHIFIVSATGKTAGEMLASLQARLLNDPKRELHINVVEQAKITRLRLEKWLAA